MRINKKKSKFLILVGAFALMFGLLAPSALAQGATTYPPTGTATFSNPSPGPGGSTTITGTTTPGATVNVTVCGQNIGSTTAGSNGTFSLTVTIPTNLAAGTCALAVTAGGLTLASSTVTIAGAGTGTGTGTGTGSTSGGLPNTGSNTVPLVQLALGLVAAGGLLVLLTRKRTVTA